MDRLKIFTIWLLIILLFAGCRTGMPSDKLQEEFQNIEYAVLEGKWNEVRTYSEKLLVRDQDNVIVHFVLSIAYYMEGKYELQEKQYPWVLRDARNVDDIVVWCENLVQRFPQNYYARFLLGSAYPIKDEMDKAIESYKKALEINPNLADAYAGLGAVYADIEQVDEAIRYFQKAIEINPTYIAAYLNLASTYEYNDQTDVAIAFYEKAIEINPAIAGAYISLGDLYLSKGDTDKAIKTYNKVIELEPGSELSIYAKEMIEKVRKD